MLKQYVPQDGKPHHHYLPRPRSVGPEILDGWTGSVRATRPGRTPRLNGRKELVALTDGYRESTESWVDLLRDCHPRGMTAPVLAVRDGVLGFWKAVREMFPATRKQRCW